MMKTFEQLISECPWYHKRVHYECAANDFDPVCYEANCAPYYFYRMALQSDSYGMPGNDNLIVKDMNGTVIEPG